MDSYVDVFKKYAVFSGRSARKEFWMFTLINMLVCFGIMMIEAVLGTGGVLYGLYYLAIFIPSLAVGIRRLHDTDRSGWWFLINFVPVIGIFIFIAFMIFDGTVGANRFGEDPKGRKLTSTPGITQVA